MQKTTYEHRISEGSSVVCSSDLPPLIHHEDGCNSDEANGLKSSRNNFRRMALGSAHAVVVPSAKLADIALRQWGQSTNKVRLIRNGIDVGRYGVRDRKSTRLNSSH